jgi:hypothetical protein
MLLSITPTTLAHEISKANDRIYYSGAGIDTEVSEALINSKQKNPSVDIIVVIDCTAHARRLGYGNQESIKRLQSSNISVFQQQGVRLSFCLADQRGWVFSFPPQLIEGLEQHDGFNCIELDAQQIKPLVEQLSILTKPDFTPDNEALISTCRKEQSDVNQLKQSELFPWQQIKTISNSARDDQPFLESISDTNSHLKPFVFATKVKKLTGDEVKKIDQELEQNPPQRFDVSQQVQVFNSRVEFVEVELIGGYIDRHVFKFPDEIKKLISDDAEAQKRLSASYKLIDSTSKISSKTISSDVDSLRRKFLKPVGKLGRVILRAQKENFQKELTTLRNKIENYKKELEVNLKKELEKSKKSLITALIDRVKANPPDELKFGIETKNVTKAQAHDYLDKLLDKYMPKPEQLLGAIELKCHFKAVTYEMLSDEEFQKQLKFQFPHVQWVVPMEEYTAAKGE